MRTFKFTSEATVEADSEREAKEIFANTSMDFAANAECQEIVIPEQLAKTFTEILFNCLSIEELEKVRQRNRTEQDSGICHSHDFCDANEAMMKALEQHGIDLDIQDDEQNRLWNEAWSIAKANQFKL